MSGGSISLFAVHLFVNSAGIRYVPLPAPREMLLVELHPEGEEPVTPLLRELGPEGRRGISQYCGYTTYYQCDCAWYVRVCSGGELSYTIVNRPPGC